MSSRYKIITEWKTRARQAFEERERLYKDSELLDFEKYTYNRRFDDVADRKIYDVPLIAVMLRRLVASVYFRNPTLLIRSLSPEGDWAVPIITRLWNTKIRQMKLKDEMRMAIQDTFTCGWGVMKLGYDSEFVVTNEARFESEAQTMQASAVDLRKENRIAAGNPWWLRVHPADVAIQYGSRNVISGQWGVHRYFRQIDELKADPRFENTRDLKPDMDLPLAKTGDLSLAYQGDLPSGPGKTEGLVLVYEIRDLKEGRVRIVCANQKDRWLYNDVDEITNLIHRLPFYFNIFNPLSKSPYGTSTVDLMDKPQKEYNDIRTQDAKQRRISIVKMLMQRGVLKEDELENFTSEAVGPVIEVDGAVDDSRIRVFQPHPGMEMQIAAENTRRDLQEIAGMGRPQTGAFSSGRHTALEASQVQGAHDLMIQDYRNTVADVILDLVSDAHKLIAGIPGKAGFWTDERLIDLIGPMGQRQDVPFKGSDLRGDYSFEVDVDTSPPPSRSEVKQERMLVAQSLANHPRVNQDYLLRWVAEAFDDLDSNRLIIPEKQYNEAMKQTLQAQQQQQEQGRQQEEASERDRREQETDAKLQSDAVQTAVSGQNQSSEGSE